MNATLIVGAVMALFGATHTITAHICDPITQPIITSPSASATLTAGAVTIDGTAQAGSIVVIRVDGNVAAQITADSSNLFTAQVTLASGTHTIDALATNSCSTTAASSSISATVNSSSAPTPIPTPVSNPSFVSSPVRTAASSAPASSSTQPPPASGATGSAFVITVDKLAADHSGTDPSIILSGTTNRPATIIVKRGDVILAQTYTTSTSYRLRIPLIEGDNDVAIIATDEGGAVISHHETYVRKPLVAAATSSKQSGFIWWPMAALFLAPITIGGFWWFIVWRRKRRYEDERKRQYPMYPIHS